MAKKLSDLAGKPFGECIAEYFAGQKVELYLGEKSGSNYYAEYDVEQKVCVTGVIKGAVGEMIVLDVEITNKSGEILKHKEVIIHSWSITGVALYDPKYKLTHVFQEQKR